MQTSRSRLAIFLTGQALSNTGQKFANIAVFWVALTFTGKAISLGALGSAWLFASAIANLIAGTIVDRFRRRNLLIVLKFSRSLLSLTLFFFAWTDNLNLWHLWVFLITEGILQMPSGIAFRSLLPDLVDKKGLVRFNGILNSWGRIDDLVEATIAGFIIGIWGPAPIFLINSATYLIGGVAPLVIKEPMSRHQPTRWKPWAELWVTARYMAGERLLRKFTLLNLSANLLFVPLVFVTPLIASEMALGAEGYGLFESLATAGLLVGGLFSSTVGAHWSKPRMWIGGQVLLALSFLSLGIFFSSSFAFIAFFISGLGRTGGFIYGRSLLQQILPGEHRGRIMGTFSFLGGIGQPLVLSLAMLSVDQFGIVPVLIVLALLLLTISGIAVVTVPLRETEWVLHPPGDRLLEEFK